MKQLHEIMRDLREDHDMTQKDVAAYLRISQQCYSSYERGRCGVPTEIVAAVARLYGVSADYLLGVDSGFYGGVNLMNLYYDDVTMYQVLYDIQKIKANKRQELLHYVFFLANFAV